MCTLSYVPTGKYKVITSNRDEHSAREAASLPLLRSLNGRKVYYPEDAQSKGSWFGVREDGSVLVLLNGAEYFHVPTPPYRKSRGLIHLELLAEETPEIAWEQINLSDIEPFTCILLNSSGLFQLRWNGIVRTKQVLDYHQPHLWCSSTLYTAHQRVAREASFHRLLNRQPGEQLPEQLMQLHCRPDTSENPGFLLNRNGVLLSKNILQLIAGDESSSLHFKDLIHQHDHLIEDLFQ